VATDAGRLLFICNTYRDPTKELEYIALLHGHRTAAIVLAGSGYHHPEAAKAIANRLRLYERSGGRVTVIGRHAHSGGGPAGDAVLPANEDGGWQAGTELYRLGHHRIGVIAGPQQLTTTTDRLAGLRRAARDHHRGISPRRVAYADFDRDSGAAAAAALLDADPGLTALAVLNDTMAIGALAVTRERGLAVPGRLSVIGFDDMPIARDLTPALTTVRLPLTEIGATAMRLALEPPVEGPPRSARAERFARARGAGTVGAAGAAGAAEPDAGRYDGGEPRVVEVPAELVRRASTAAPPP
jgi:LacI family transcriptional regulator